MRRRFRLILSGALAVLAVMLCVLYGQSVREEAERVRSEALERYGGEVVRLVVAQEGLEPGDVVSRQNTVEREWLADLAPAGAIVGFDSVVGSEVTVPIAAGAPLTSLNFRSDESSLEVPSGMVALSLPVTEKLGLPLSAAAGTVLVAYEVEDGGAVLVAEELQVLRMPFDQSGVGSRGSVTVAADPDDVSGVLLASAEGSLRLAMPADDVSELREAPERATQVPAEPNEDNAAEESEEKQTSSTSSSRSQPEQNVSANVPAASESRQGQVAQEQGGSTRGAEGA